MRDARIVGILYHHGIGDVAVSELIHVRSAPIGATATLVYLSYVECQVEIPREMAQVMLMALLSDTRDLDKQVTLADRMAYDALAEIAWIVDLEALYRGMTETLSDYSGMTDLQIFLSDYKEYEVNGTTFGIADTRALSDPAARDLADRMIAVMEEYYEELGLDMLFAMIKNVGDDEPVHPMYMVAYGEGAEMLMQKVFTMPDGSGYYVFDEIYSRKTDVVPALTDALN